MNDDIVDRLQRLRDLGLRKGPQGLAKPARSSERPSAEDAVGGAHGGAIPGERVDTPFGPAWEHTERYPLTDHPDLEQILAARPETLAALGRDPALAGMEPSRIAFVDTETTGLSMGTDTYTFLIGIGTYETDAFVVRQFFMRNPGEERAQLHLVEAALGACTGLVSFNGRTFDLPLLTNRFVLANLGLPMAGAPHLDLLPPARRIWRARLRSCALGELERSVLDVRRTDEDVPGWMIPDIYRDFYRTGRGAELVARVFYHNRVDITSMALLAGRLARLFEPQRLHEHLRELPVLDCASLARCYGALEWHEACEVAYRGALTAALTDSERTLVLRELSFLLKRRERVEEAAELWEEWITSVVDDDITPHVELAKYHEWRTGDLAVARGWAAWALRLAERQPAGYDREATLAELRHRLARLERKLAGAAEAADETDDASRDLAPHTSS